MMNKIFALFICLILSGCGSTMMIETIPFHYNHNYEHKAVIDLQKVNSLAILPFNGPGGKAIEDGLKEKFFQAGHLRIIDSIQLSRIIQEKQLEVTDTTLQNLGGILNIELFIAGDVVLSDGITVITNLRFLDSTGQIIFIRIVKGRDIPAIIDGITNTMSDMQIPVNVDRELVLPASDPDNKTITNLIAQQQLQEIRQLLEKKIPFATTGTFKDRTYYHYNLAIVYEALDDINSAQAEIEKAIEKTIWTQNKALFTSYKEYLDRKAMQRQQITTILTRTSQEEALKIAVLKFQAADENIWKIQSELITGIALVGKYNIYGRGDFLEFLQKKEMSTDTIGQILGVDYIISGTLKRSPGIILQTLPSGDSIEKAFYEIQFSVTDVKTGTIKTIETITGEYPMRTDLSRERLLYEAKIDAIDKFVRKVSLIL